ncbi:putative ABC-type nitrate/sulfonate/bicarbonate transport system, periplasmic component [Haemophilus influenzae 22.1-21]|nr:putative ABC-type nitrate/sulfonate/bicarbonate transport system, periplasmic component [Haemophilus influenzae 22.1-21]
MKIITRYFSFVIGLMLTLPSFAKEKISVMLDWYVNPDHAAIIVAQQKGFFEKIT